MTAVINKLKAALQSDAATVVMGLLLAYGYIRMALSVIDYLVEIYP